jgi:hypothetical protein
MIILITGTGPAGLESFIKSVLSSSASSVFMIQHYNSKNALSAEDYKVEKFESMAHYYSHYQKQTLLQKTFGSCNKPWQKFRHSNFRRTRQKTEKN